jgi:FixJ family two-component response regulator
MVMGMIASSRRGPIVSIVDDDAGMRTSLTDLLDSVGCQSRCFDSSEQFLSCDAAQTSDLVITDIQMGKLDGLGLLNHLRNTLGSSVPVIVITALTDEELQHRAAAEGCFAFLRKPFDPDTLLCHVKEAVALP